jgi:hypothetical protein
VPVTDLKSDIARFWADVYGIVSGDNQDGLGNVKVQAQWEMRCKLRHLLSARDVYQV